MLTSMPPPVAPHLLPQLGHVDSITSSAVGASLATFSMPSSKRPKLSLQTSALPTSYGSSATSSGNKPDSLTTTPTTLNTFANTFELAVRPSPNSSTASPAVFQNRPKSRSSSPFHRERPYELNLPFGIKPILKNSLLNHDYSRSSVASTASPRVGRKVFFPAPKKVSFRPVLEDEIVTYTYTARNVDLTTSEDEVSSSSECEITQKQQTNAGRVPSTPSVLAVSDDDDTEDTCSDSSDTTPLSNKVRRAYNTDARERRLDHGRHGRKVSTPAPRVRRKKRRWEWTLESDEQLETVYISKQEKEGITTAVVDITEIISDSIEQEILAEERQLSVGATDLLDLAANISLPSSRSSSPSSQTSLQITREDAGPLIHGHDQAVTKNLDSSS